MIAAIERTYTREGREASKSYSIEGTRLIERALRSGQSLLRAAHGPAYGDTSREREVLDRIPDTTERQMLEAGEMARLTGQRDYGAIIGILPLAPGRSLTEATPKPRLFLVADEIRDPGNLGAMIRTGLASWADGMLAIGVSDPWHPKAVRTSMGSLFKMPVYRAADSERAIEQLKAEGYTCIGSCLEGDTPLPELSLSPGPVALFMGSESFGLSAHTLEQMDLRVTIPMPEGVDSFSVNAATAVLLHEIRRQQLQIRKPAKPLDEF